jgi:hypothetical protein
MEENKGVYQENAIAYMVNYKGQKVKPYRSVPQKTISKWQKIINFFFN